MTTPARALFTNNAGTTLALSVTNVATTATLASGAGALFPSPAAGEFFPITFIASGNPLIFEICYCTARSGDVITITRAQEGTSALAWNAGDFARLLLTAGCMALANQWGMHGQFQSVTSGNFTVAAGVYKIKLELWGGGGAALGGSGGTGGGGGYITDIVDVTPGQVIAYTIGAAGVASGVAPGTAGGNSTFAATAGTYTANGGGGGGAGEGAGGGGSGPGSTRLILIGQNGVDIDGDGSGGTTGNGLGGNSPRGGFGGHLNGSNVGGTPTVPGGGGGANAVSNFFCQNGATGMIFITW